MKRLLRVKKIIPLVSKLKANNIDAVYLGSYHTEGGLIVRQMRDQGMSTKLISGDALVTAEYWDIHWKCWRRNINDFQSRPKKQSRSCTIS